MIQSWLDIVAGEFREMPGLRLTLPQAARLWGLEPRACAAILDALVERGALGQAHDGRYCRLSEMWRVAERQPAA